MKQPVEFRIEEIRQATGGTLLGGRVQQLVHGVCTDTREIEPGDLFVALKGERFDGHAFLAQALARGAAGLLVAGAAVPSLPTLETGPDASVPVIAVDEPRLALGRLALWHRSRFQVQLVGITGSNGKTSTKELLAEALAEFGPTLRTRGNFNNELGLPMTLLGLNEGHCYAALEMGMNHPGEIAYLASLALPCVGLVTNIAAAHTAGVGDVEGVAAAKGELYAALPPDGIAVVNLDDHRVVAQAATRTTARRVTFGRAPGADVHIVEAVPGGGRPGRGGGSQGVLEVDGSRLPVQLKLVGAHNVVNAAAALAACLGLGLDCEQALSAMELVPPSPHRMVLVRVQGRQVLDDCYNANPASMLAALDTLEQLVRQAGAAQGSAVRCFAVLGEMLELGELEEQLHRQVGRRAAELGLELLVTVGERARALGDEARARGLGARWLHATEAAGVGRRLLGVTRPGDFVLLKGSRRVGLERVLDELKQVEGE
ncbi:MAG: UDP-N-acetylmuramoyl-tripeptide--D-alanyl-D-alanine ligase [Deltaproteobacteria bacterium]|nr:UDP-N-acetylmuramoyl-tripeptide--D-alanyl-D-alanine ligase [Deltaproteobacteria bacterium]